MVPSRQRGAYLHVLWHCQLVEPEDLMGLATRFGKARNDAAFVSYTKAQYLQFMEQLQQSTAERRTARMHAGAVDEPPLTPQRKERLMQRAQWRYAAIGWHKMSDWQKHRALEQEILIARRGDSRGIYSAGGRPGCRGCCRGCREWCWIGEQRGRRRRRRRRRRRG